MRVDLLFAEHAAVSTDGTFSVRRGGLRDFDAQMELALVRGNLLVMLEHHSSDAGSHQLRLQTVDEDGNHVTGAIQTTFETPPATGNMNVAVNLSFQLPPGRYEFHAILDRHFVACWPITVRPGVARAGSSSEPSAA